jgi:Family of unknown function (DUF5923)
MGEDPVQCCTAGSHFSTPTISFCLDQPPICKDWARLTRDLLFDSEGSLKFKPALWNNIRNVVLPQLIDQVFLVYS